MASIRDLYPQSQVVPGRDASLQEPEVLPAPRSLNEDDQGVPPSLNVYRGTNPDVNARKTKMGLPVEIDDEAANVEWLRRREEEAVRDAPKTAGWLRNPDNAAVAHDQLEELGFVENMVRGWTQTGAGLIGDLIRYNAIVPGPIQMVVGRENLEAAASTLQNLDAGYRPVSSLDEVLDDPININTITWAIQEGLVSVPDMALAIASLPVSAAARSASIAQSRAENDQRANATMRDLLFAMPAGAASAMLDRFGGRGILGLDDVLKGQGALAVARATGAGAAKEAGTEAVQSFIENMGSTLGTFEGFDLRTAAREAAGGAIVGGIFGGTVRATTATAENIGRGVAAKRAKAAMDSIHERVVSSKLWERDPQKAAEHVAAVMQEQGTSRPMFVTGEALREWLYQDPNPDRLIARMGISEQLAENEALGTDIRIDAETFAREILVSERYGDIASHIKTSPEAMTDAEADEYAKSGIEEDIRNLDHAVAAEHLRAFHGTPHQFERFESSKIGIGEGAQAFGFGLYFAEAEAVAQGYRNRLSGVTRNFTIEGQTFNADGIENYILERMTDGPDSAFNRQITNEILFDLSSDQPWGMDKMRAQVERADISRGEKERYFEAIDIAKNIEVGREEGFLYTVRIKARPEQLLDFDKPMNEQSEEVQAAYKKMMGYNPGAMKGQEWYHDLEAEFMQGTGPVREWWNDNGKPEYRKAAEVVSMALLANGIQGNRYLDADSRDSGEGTANIVVYDDSLVQIESINGEPVPIPEVPVKQEGSAENSLELAEEELGLKALFQTADEAGMSPAKYKSYLAALDRAAQAKKNKAELIELNREKKQNSVEMMEARAIEREKIREHVSGFQTYSAFNNIAAIRLDRDSAAALMKEMGRSLKELPRQAGNRSIVAAEGEPGMNVDTYAQLNGYKNGYAMLWDFMSKPSMDEVIDQRLDQVMGRKYGHLFSKRAQIDEAIKELHNDTTLDVLELELNALRVAAGEKRLEKKLLKQAARLRLQKTHVGEINPLRYTREAAKFGKEAGKLLRKGDREAAKKAKFQQILHHRLAQESYRMQEKVEAHRKYLAQFQRNRKRFKKFHPSFLVAIRQLLENVGLEKARTTREPNPVSRKQAAKRFEERGAATSPVAVPSDLLTGPFNYQNMELGKFEELVDKVKELHHAGQNEGKLRRQRKERERDLAVAFISDGVRKNLKGETNKDAVSPSQSRWAKAKKNGKEYLLTLFHMDTLVSEVDGFSMTDTVAYDYLKKPYDEGMTQGYLKDDPRKKGFIPRSQEVGQKLIELYGNYTKKEWVHLNKKFQIPGMDRMVSRNDILSVLLNSGNDQNVAALLDTNTVTEQEIQAIRDYATKKDWDFVQSVWDYLDTFWDEIVDAEVMRRGGVPTKVQATPIVTKHGTYAGGYFPISYDQDLSPVFDPSSVDDIYDNVKFGNYVSSHTAHGHAEERTRANKNFKVKLDVGVLDRHLNRVVYDLEMGDAVHDIHKVLMHKDLTKTFAETGNKHKWEMMELWLRDAITHEVGVDNITDRALRHIRTGFTVSVLGFNVSIASLQLLGLSQTAALLGKKNVLKGLYAVMKDPGMAKKIGEQSAFMKDREETFHKDILDARSRTQPTWLDRALPNDTADSVRASLYWMLKKMQRMVDVVTWVAAMHHGMEITKGDEAKSIEIADRAVRNSQGSGIFGDRSAIERGSLSPTKQQTEMVRLFTALIGYFITRNNIVYRRVKQVKTVPQALNLAVDMALMFAGEIIVAHTASNIFDALTGVEDEEDEGEWWGVLADIAATSLAGFPFIRDAVSAAQGFSGGGVIGSVTGEVGRALVQTSQLEVDEAFIKSWNNVFGVFMKYPSRQINKIVGAANKEEATPQEWLYGPEY